MIKKSLFSLLHLIGISHILNWQKRNTITVLSLHRVSCEEDYFWNPISPRTFEKLLQYIIKHYNVISFNDIPFLRKDNSSKPALILSFDDGYYDFYEHALPLLKKYNVPCNHNIVNVCAANNQIIWTQRLNFIFNYCKTNHLSLSFAIEDDTISLESFNGNWIKFYLDVYKILLTIPKAERLSILNKKENEFLITPVCKMMNWQQIIECSENLVEIGSHTYTHDILSTITDATVLKKEIIDSVNEIENQIHKKINVLALPNGRGNDKIIEVLSGSEIEYILFVDDKINELEKRSGKEIKSIYRINIAEESYAEMIFRIELLHSKIKKYAQVLYPKNWLRKF